MMYSSVRFHDDLDAAVLLGAKCLVKLRSLFERGAVRDDEGRIDLAFLDPFEKLGQVMLHRGLRHAERQSAIDRGPHGYLVDEPAIHPNDGNCAEVAAAVNRLPQNMRPIGAHECRNLDAVEHGICTGHCLGLGADRIDTRIRAPAFGQFHDPVVDIFLHEIEGLGAALARQIQPFGNSINSNDAFGAEQEGALDRELANRSTSPDGNSFSASDAAELGSHVAGRKNVREKKDLLVAQAIRHLHWSDVGIRDAKIFGLAAGVAAEKMRITKESCRRVAPEFRRLFMIGIGAFASGKISSLAEEAFAASNREGHYDAVADLERLVVRADLDNLTHRFMAENIPTFHL